MRGFYLVVGWLALAGSLFGCVASKGAVHETYAAVLFLIGMVCMGISSVMLALDDLRRAVLKLAERDKPGG